MKSNLQNSKHKILNTNHGITLVVLIITIIVLLILSIATIRLAINGGIIDKTEKAVNDYKADEENEQIQLGYSNYQLAKSMGRSGNLAIEGATVTGNGPWTVEFSSGRIYQVSLDGTITGSWKDNGNGSYTKGSATVQVGDIVHYETELAKTANAVNSTKKASLISDLGTYSGNTDSSKNTDSSVVRDSLTWKVLDVKDGKIRLISTVPTTSLIRLYSYNGYNNAVYLLDKACDTLYSINGVGKAQNLKIEDIEEKLKIVDGKTARENYTNTNATPNLKYGDEKEYTSNLQYPNLYASEIGCKAIATSDNTGNTLGLSEQTSPVTGSSTATNRLKVTQTYWSKKMESTDFTDSKYYTLFINYDSEFFTYVLSSRCIHCSSSNANFGVRVVSNGSVLRYSYIRYEWGER